MAFTRKTAIVAQRRKGTDDDPFVNITETFVVKDNKVLLSEIPDKFNKVVVKDPSIEKVYTETFDDFVLDEYHYRVDYSMGFVEFANSENNKALEFSYSGTGIYLFPASRVWTKLNLSNNVVQTLEDMLTIDGLNGQIGTLSDLTTTNKDSLVSAINELDNDKVDKVTGKKLSTEDYTTAEKTKLESIATGANNYTHPATHSISEVDSLQDILDSKVDDSQVLTNVPSNAKFTDTITTINGKTGVITKSDITALGIPEQDTVYIHPSEHPASMITESATRRFVSDTEKSTWNTVTDKVDKVSGKQLSTEDYTTAEKTKLSGIASGANNYTHPTSHPASMVTVTDSGNHYNSSNVEDALAEIKTYVNEHMADNVTLVAAINEVKGDVNDLETNQGDLATLNTTAKTSLVGAINELFTSVSSGKSQLETAITDKDGTVSKVGSVATFDELEDGIDSIPQAKGNALASQVLETRTFSSESAGIEVEGTMPNRGAVNITLTLDGSTYTIPLGYHNGSGTVTVDITNLIASNIKAGVTVGGVQGTFTSDATMNSADLLSGKTGYKNGSKITGTMPNRGSKTFTPTKSTQTGSSGYYSSVKCNPIPSSYYGVGDTITSGNLYMLSSPSGSEVWTFTGHTDIVNSVAVDSSGYVYSGSFDYTVRKISPSGDEVWRFTGHTDTVRAVAVDSSGYVYSGSFDGTVKKIKDVYAEYEIIS